MINRIIGSGTGQVDTGTGTSSDRSDTRDDPEPRPEPTEPTDRQQDLFRGRDRSSDDSEDSSSNDDPYQSSSSSSRSSSIDDDSSDDRDDSSTTTTPTRSSGNVSSSSDRSDTRDDPETQRGPTIDPRPDPTDPTDRQQDLFRGRDPEPTSPAQSGLEDEVRDPSPSGDVGGISGIEDDRRFRNDPAVRSQIDDLEEAGFQRDEFAIRLDDDGSASLEFNERLIQQRSERRRNELIQELEQDAADEGLRTSDFAIRERDTDDGSELFVDVSDQRLQERAEAEAERQQREELSNLREDVASQIPGVNARDVTVDFDNGDATATASDRSIERLVQRQEQQSRTFEEALPDFESVGQRQPQSDDQRLVDQIRSPLQDASEFAQPRLRQAGRAAGGVVSTFSVAPEIEQRVTGTNLFDSGFRGAGEEAAATADLAGFGDASIGAADFAVSGPQDGRSRRDATDQTVAQGLESLSQGFSNDPGRTTGRAIGAVGGGFVVGTAAVRGGQAAARSARNIDLPSSEFAAANRGQADLTGRTRSRQSSSSDSSSTTRISGSDISLSSPVRQTDPLGRVPISGTPRANRPGTTTSRTNVDPPSESSTLANWRTPSSEIDTAVTVPSRAPTDDLRSLVNVEESLRTDLAAAQRASNQQVAGATASSGVSTADFLSTDIDSSDVSPTSQTLIETQPGAQRGARSSGIAAAIGSLSSTQATAQTASAIGQSTLLDSLTSTGGLTRQVTGLQSSTGLDSSTITGLRPSTTTTTTTSSSLTTPTATPTTPTPSTGVPGRSGRPPVTPRAPFGEADVDDLDADGLGFDIDSDTFDTGVLRPEDLR